MKGWECPRCGRCYAPFVTQCFTCQPGIAAVIPAIGTGGAVPPALQDAIDRATAASDPSRNPRRG